MSERGFSIKALQHEDVPEAAKLSADAFETDRQTEMKALGQQPWNMKEYSLESLPQLLSNPICVILKAVDDQTGEIAGVCNWGFRGIPPEERPYLDGRIAPSVIPAPSPIESENEPETPKKESESSSSPKPEKNEGPIQRLIAHTNADMVAWQKEVEPPGTQCLFIIGLSVSPRYQGRGIGSALLRWGTQFCDEKEIFAWVHSSEPAWKMYEKSGFQVIRALDVDLDEYAPCPPPNEGPDAKWGHYVFRYMKYYGSRTSRK